jgi:hypothetical protein
LIISGRGKSSALKKLKKVVTFLGVVRSRVVEKYIMNVEFPKIMSNLKLGEVGARQADNVDKITENAAKQLFSNSLVITESENFALGDIGEMDMDEIEKELVRDDKLGKLFSFEFKYEPPEMPVFV